MNVDAQKYDPRSSVTIRTWANKWKRAPPHSASRWTLRAERQAPSLGTPHDHTSRRGEVSNSNTKSLARGQRTPSGVTRVGVCQEIPQRIFRALIQPAPRLPEPSAMAVCALFVLSRYKATYTPLNLFSPKNCYFVIVFQKSNQKPGLSCQYPEYGYGLLSISQFICLQERVGSL